jgi:2-amino-4-hydroxy-6-hydroxymethyldihydropteridine diphosphokinase
MQTAYIGLGSNLNSAAGSPRATLTAAISALGAVGYIVAQSSFYETEPLGYADQPKFLNNVITLETKLAPFELLLQLLAIERAFGRDRANTPPKGPRTLDPDLLLVDNLILDTPELTLPHPALTERRFVLAPLAEIAPNIVHPATGKTIAALLAELPEWGANRLESVNIS